VYSTYYITGSPESESGTKISDSVSAKKARILSDSDPHHCPKLRCKLCYGNGKETKNNMCFSTKQTFPYSGISPPFFFLHHLTLLLNNSFALVGSGLLVKSIVPFTEFLVIVVLLNLILSVCIRHLSGCLCMVCESLGPMTGRPTASSWRTSASRTGTPRSVVWKRY
jgi:hypothetical protein